MEKEARNLSLRLSLTEKAARERIVHLLSERRRLAITIQRKLHQAKRVDGEKLERLRKLGLLSDFNGSDTSGDEQNTTSGGHGSSVEDWKARTVTAQDIYRELKRRRYLESAPLPEINIPTGPAPMSPLRLATSRGIGSNLIAYMPGTVDEEGRNRRYTRKTPENRVRKYKPPSYNAEGEITVPGKYGQITIKNMGSIEFNDPSYHTERYIYPVDYHVVREFSSFTDPKMEHALYSCKIERSTEGPLFIVTPLDQPFEEPFSGRSTSGAWSKIFNEALKIRGKPPSTSICGPDLFGLTVAEIAKLIQDMENADKCLKYKWQTFLMTGRSKSVADDSNDKDHVDDQDSVSATGEI